MNYKKIYITIVFFIYSCTTPKRPYWIFLTEQNSNIIVQEKDEINFQFFIEPNSDLQKVENLITKIYHFIDLLKSYPYFEIKKTNYKIVIYKNFQSYVSYKPFKIDSVAHFDRNKKEIHYPLTISQNNISNSIPEFVIYHELIHAFLEECCEYPIWLNEGLALLLQNIKEEYKCGQSKILIPYGLIANKKLLIQKQVELPFYPNFEKTQSIYEHNLMSGLYIYYLWENQKLLNIIHLFKNENFSYFEHETKKELNQYQKLKKDFYQWLKKIPDKEYFLIGC